ncbi:SphA family protein [Sphaerochaeta sp.]|uniref:SphA family protein n=1 Tax=Sphaerochaeta sp. TaxID=1972642 RepID=UPI003D0DFA49
MQPLNQNSSNSVLRIGFLLLCMVFILSHASGAYAQHYGIGSEGIKAGTLPGPGYYYLMYNQFYSSDRLNDKDGDKIHNGFDLNTFANVHRFVWITDKKILGGDYGMNIIVPLVNVDIDIDAAGVSESSFKLGDINIEPFVLGWHGSGYDGVLGLSVFLPTGYYDEDDSSSTGQDHATFMTTLGGTYYPDQNSNWSLSVLGRYEKHFENRDKDLTCGDDLSIEWGVGRKIGLLDVGLVGYGHWQLTEDDGSDAVSDDKDSILAVGPEVQIAVPALKAQVRVKYYKEFEAKDTNEGDTVWLTFVKAF